MLIYILESAPEANWKLLSAAAAAGSSSFFQCILYMYYINISPPCIGCIQRHIIQIFIIFIFKIEL